MTECPKTCFWCEAPIVGNDLAGWLNQYFHPDCVVKFADVCYGRNE